MTPIEILDALRQLPPAERLLVIEAALHMTREEMAQSAPPQTEPEQKMAQARERLYASLEEDEEDKAEQGFLQKIFRVFTQEN